jgi:hypothetical protein
MKPMNFVKLMSVSICLLSFLFLTQGCLNDDLSVCGVRLSFNYPDSLGDNRFEADVRKANVYIFDAATGLFVSEYAATFEQLVDGHILPINLGAGRYHFITWGNVGDNFEITHFVPDSSLFSDARLTLNALDNIVREYPDSLYYGIDTVEVKASDLVLNKEIGLNLIKNNKKINVTTKVLFDDATVDPSSVHCSITSKNGTYRFDNIPTGEQYTYIPPFGQELVDSTDYSLRSNFIILREFDDNSFTESQLKITSDSGGTRQEGAVDENNTAEGFEYKIPLTNCLAPIAAAIGDAIEDIDEFDIEIVLSETNGSISVTVRDWNDGGDGEYPVIL